MDNEHYLIGDELREDRITCIVHNLLKGGKYDIKPSTSPLTGFTIVHHLLEDTEYTVVANHGQSWLPFLNAYDFAEAQYIENIANQALEKTYDQRELAVLRIMSSLVYKLPNEI